MRAIGPIAEAMKTDLDQIRQDRRRLRVSLAEQHGWDPDAVTCMFCGDRGYEPGPARRPCLACEHGRTIGSREQRRQQWTSKVPRRFREYTLEGHPDQAAVAKCRPWIEAESGHGGPGRTLVLSGPVGTGKTGMAIGVLRELFIAGKNFRFGTVPDILHGLRPPEKGQPPPPDQQIKIYDLQRVPVLLMDDIGAEKSSEWVAETLYVIANGRYERSLPTILTTNRPISTLRTTVGDRAMSRLLEGCTPVVVDGPDRRRTAGTGDR